MKRLYFAFIDAVSVSRRVVTEGNKLWGFWFLFRMYLKNNHRHRP